MEHVKNEPLDNQLHEPMVENAQTDVKKELFEAFGLGALFAEEKALRDALMHYVSDMPHTADNDLIGRKIERACVAMDEESQQLVNYIEAVMHEMQAHNVGPQDPKARDFLFKAGVAQRILLERNIEKLKELHRLCAPSKKSKKA